MQRIYNDKKLGKYGKNARAKNSTYSVVVCPLTSFSEQAYAARCSQQCPSMATVQPENCEIWMDRQAFCTNGRRPWIPIFSAGRAKSENAENTGPINQSSKRYCHIRLIEKTENSSSPKKLSGSKNLFWLCNFSTNSSGFSFCILQNGVKFWHEIPLRQIEQSIDSWGCDMKYRLMTKTKSEK